MLEQFFKPHTVTSLMSLAYLLFVFDIAGWNLIRLLKLSPPKFLRPTLWFFGLAQMVFLVFLSHFFIPYNGLSTILFSTLISWPWVKSYLRTNQHRKLLEALKPLKTPLLIFLPLVPLVFIKTSLPPYIWDEAAYHYISPYKLLYEKTWHFGGLYRNIPRLLDTAFVSLFALTKSYASSRLLHFLVYFSCLSSIYLFTRKHLGNIAGLVTFVVLTYLQIPLLIQSTWGYVDLGVTSFIILSVLSFVEFVLKPNNSLFYLFLLYTSLALGVKYNAIAPSAVVGLLFLIFIYIKPRSHSLKPKKTLVVFLTGLILGGYWYIKNWVITGNPIYPFFFSCRTGNCGAGQSFFAWADAFNLVNLPKIIKSVLFNHDLLTPASLIIIFIALVTVSKKYKKILLLLITIVAGEYLLLSRIAGFNDRYFYHWNIILSLVFSLSLYLTSKSFLSSKKIFLKIMMFFFAVVFGIFIFGKRLIAIYKPYLPGGQNYYQTRFALGRASVKDWIKWTLPATSEILLWCDQQPKITSIISKDPMLTWFTNETKYRIFLTNCVIKENPGLEKERYYVSLDDCQSLEKLPPRPKNEDKRRLQMAWENHSIICRSKKIVPGLYLLVE